LSGPGIVDVMADTCCWRYKGKIDRAMLAANGTEAARCLLGRGSSRWDDSGCALAGLRRRFVRGRL